MDLYSHVLPMLRLEAAAQIEAVLAGDEQFDKQYPTDALAGLCGVDWGRGR